jgi:predicted PurR-regulated permease PerM
MNRLPKSDDDPEPRTAANLLEVLIRAGLILILAIICYKVFSPFMIAMVWAVILAVTLYPLHQRIARWVGGRQGIASTLLLIVGFVLIAVPTAILVNSLGDSVNELIHKVQANSLQIPAPPDQVAGWPLVGEKLHAIWSQAHADLPSLVESLQPKIGDLAKSVLGFVAAIGGGLLMFMAALIVSGIIMAFGESGARGSRAIFDRVIGPERGGKLAELSTATIRAVAQGGTRHSARARVPCSGRHHPHCCCRSHLRQRHRSRPDSPHPHLSQHVIAARTRWSLALAARPTQSQTSG